jgi:hypothetical protein
MKTSDTTWPVLAGAAADARDALRYLVPKLDRAIVTADASVLEEVRRLAVCHANSLKTALKHPRRNVRKRATRG